MRKSYGRRLLYTLAGVFLLNISVANAAFVIDFGTGLAGSGGTIDDVNGDGSHIIGTDITIGSLEAVGTGADGVHVANALLDFDTSQNSITVNGIVSGLGINSPIDLLVGSFNSWNYGTTNGGVSANFSGSGIDIKHSDLLTALGIPLDTQFEFFAFSLGFDFDTDGNATAISTDIINTSVVPVPPAVWLFGSGLLGLAGIARRKAA